MKTLKRLILVISFCPMIIFLGLRWIVTGKDLQQTMDKYVNYFNK